MVDELVDRILAFVHVVGIPEDFGQPQGGLLVLLDLFAPMALIELDQTLECESITRFEGCSSNICSFGLVKLILLV